MTANDAPRRKWRKDYAPYPFEVTHTALDFELNASATTVRSRLQLKRRPGSDAAAPLALDGEGLDTVSLARDGQALDIDELERDAEGRLLVPGFGAEGLFEAVVRINPSANRALEGLYLSNGIFCTQCEAEGFRRITWYPDRPDVMSCFDVSVTGLAEGTPVLLANGNREAEEMLEDGRRRVHWRDPFPKPSYLFALVAGDLACHAGEFTRRSGKKVALEIWVEAENLDRCEHALASLQRAMKWDEDCFGLEYDLDLYMIVAVSDFNMGAMENKGLNVFNAKYVLAIPETATDDDYEHIEGVIAHEYFHNWTGNRVTCRDWFQLTLKEGLTVYRDQIFTADMTSQAVKRISDVRSLRVAQFVEDAGPMAHPIRPESYIEMNNFYTSTVYEKGAEVVRMYATLLGAEGFRRGMDLYFERHDGQAVTCNDFRLAMGDANDSDLGMLERWYEQPGTPELYVREAWDEASKVLTLDLAQRNPGSPDSEPLPIPVRIALLSSSGGPQPLHAPEGTITHDGEAVFILDVAQKRWVLPCPEGRPVVSLLRGFSAPVKLRAARDAEDLAFRMQHETDPFNRWDAGQELAFHVALAAEQAIAEERPVEVPTPFIDAVRAVLVDEELDGSLKALALVLPSERLLSQRVSEVHLPRLHQAKVAVRKTLATALVKDWERVYEQSLPDGPYKPDAASIHRRRLNGICLSYLARADEDRARTLLLERFQRADNMTDRQAALGLLVDLGGREALTALDAFRDRHQADQLTMDKWFSVQALAQHEGALDRILALRDHPDFTLDNPNRARALIGMFAFGNLPQFHSPDGRGYDFLEECVCELDGRNPQVAARMVTAFNDYKRFEPKAQQRMRAAIERIAARPSISKDVYEITHRALEG